MGFEEDFPNISANQEVCIRLIDVERLCLEKQIIRELLESEHKEDIMGSHRIVIELRRMLG